MIVGVNGCIANPYNVGFNGSPSNDWTSTHSCTQSDVQIRPQYAATGNVTYSGVRLPNYHQFDSNLSKNFALYDRLKLQFRLEGFNLLNHPLWQLSYDSTASSSTFGAIAKGPSAQSNLPRQVQIALKLMW